jgi:glycosyltransferase involved in cell wall biosynthesis
MQPEISIIISTYNRQKFIGECLACLSRQTLSTEKWEAVVIDNFSTDDTAIIVKTFIAANPQLPIRYVFEEKKGVSIARNRGISEASADIVCYIDDDAEAIPNYAETIVNYLHTHPEVAGIGGRVLPKYSESPEPVWMSKLVSGFIGLVDHGEPPRIFKGRMKYPIGCNMAYRKKMLVESGGFNNFLTFRADDKHVYYEVKKINPNIVYLPSAVVYHNIPASRLQFSYFKKLFLKTGNEEKVWIKTQKPAYAYVTKTIEYLFKFGVSIAIWFFYLLAGKEIKGRYVMYSQWFTLAGFFKKDVFFR